MEVIYQNAPQLRISLTLNNLSLEANVVGMKYIY